MSQEYSFKIYCHLYCWSLHHACGVLFILCLLYQSNSLFCILLPLVHLAHNVFVRHGGPRAQPGWTPTLRLSFHYFVIGIQWSPIHAINPVPSFIAQSPIISSFGHYACICYCFCHSIFSVPHCFPDMVVAWINVVTEKFKLFWPAV